MITAVRHGLNSQIFRYTRFTTKQIFPGLPIAVSTRTLYNSVINLNKDKMKNIQKIQIPINQNCPDPSQEKKSSIEKLKQTKNSNISQGHCSQLSTNPPSKNDNSSKNNSKLILAVLALGGIAGAVYYLKQSDGKDKNKSKIIDRVKVPPTSQDIPKEVPYLLIGGGTASFSAFRAIKSHVPKAKVLVISNEFEKPYMRPPLSKELWLSAKPGTMSEDFKFTQWNGAERSIFFEPSEFFVDPTKLLESPNGGVAVAHGYSVKKIDPYQKKVFLTDGTEIAYGECLIATGCSSKSLDVLDAAPMAAKDKISTYSKTDDYLALRKLAEEKSSIAIIGGGFLGSELCCALSKYNESKNLKVYQIFHETGNMADVLPEYLSKWTTTQIEDLGVCIIPKAQIDEVKLHSNKVSLSLNNGKTVLVDHVLVCIGTEPNTELASTSGLEIDGKRGGIAVNAEMEARSHLYAAGDVASFYDPLLGRRRIEHHDHAVITGRLAGENMAGLKKPFSQQSMFWSDLGPRIGCEGIGIVDSSLPTVGVFAKLPLNDDDDEVESKTSNHSNNETSGTPSSVSNEQNQEKHHKDEADGYQRGVVFYLENEKVVGILLWNIFNRLSTARKIINENKKFDDLNEVAKLFDIHT